MDDIRIRLDKLNKRRSELGVRPGELDSQRREDKPEVPPVLEVSGAKEGGAELSICGHPLSDSLGDSALPCPGETVQPVDGGLVEVADPEFDFVQDGCTRFPETTIAIAMSILGLLCVSDVVENDRFSCAREFFSRWC